MPQIDYSQDTSRNILKVGLTIITLIVVLAVVGMGGCAGYNAMRVWNATKRGEATLAEAQQDRQVKTLEAKAKQESARYEAQAEITRATGAAKANHILQNSLGGPNGYLRYLQIQAIENSKATLIYVPTEAGLPVTEANRLPGQTTPVAPE